jgi:hypothetical protein
MLEHKVFVLSEGVLFTAEYVEGDDGEGIDGILSGESGTYSGDSGTYSGESGTYFGECGL